MPFPNLDGTIRACLHSIFDEISAAEWRGREREIVSRFCFGYLIHSFNSDQLGMEVAVPQLSLVELQECKPDTKKHKRDVCKDVVIWPQPKMVTFDHDWEPSYQPLAVIEWTVINPSDSKREKKKKEIKHRYDQCWLRKKSESVENFVGYAILVDATCSPKELCCARFSSGQVWSDWVVLPTS